jgi:hypothetical protein
MNTTRATLTRTIVSMLALSLLTSVAWAAERPIGDYAHSSNGLFPEAGILKNQKDCPDGTAFFKNVAPGLTNGSGPGSTTVAFIIDGKTVSMDIDWYPDNSFDFDLNFTGVAHIVGVTSDTNNFLYDHVDYYPDEIATDAPVNSDGNLNSISDAADVNHLDLCLAAVAVAVDTEAPVVTITSPADGEAVTGLVTLTATVTDNVAVSSVTATVTDGLNYQEMINLELSQLPTQPPTYQGSWDTAALDNGPYTVSVTATDTSGNTTTPEESVNVIDVLVVTSASACEGQLDPQDPDETEGCNPSGVQNVQVPLDNKLDLCVSNDPQQPVCTITEFLLTPDPALNTAHPGTCTGDNVYADPRVNAAGFPVDIRPLFVFGELGGNPDPAVFGDDAMILDEYTYGNPCFAVVFGRRNFDLLNAFFWPEDPATGLVVVRTQFAERIDGIGPIAQCYPEPGEVGNFDLQEAAEATYQDDDRARMKAGTAEVMTNACFNPKRMSSFDFSFNALNTKEHGGIDFSSPTGPDDVLDFKIQRADAKFNFLEQALSAAESQLVSPNYSVLTRNFNQARSQFDKRNPAALTRAIEYLKDLLFEVRNGTWDLTPANNPGDVQMRTENLINRIDLIRSEVIRLESP